MDSSGYFVHLGVFRFYGVFVEHVASIWFTERPRKTDSISHGYTGNSLFMQPHFRRNFCLFKDPRYLLIYNQFFCTLFI